MRRALLLFNPEATRVSARVRDVITHAFAVELKLDVVSTKRRHHATHLAAGAAHEGYEVVVCLGGDGTLNEVVNGLVGTDVPLIPLPGGGTNVFARTMGLPKDPIEATSVALERLAEDAEPKRINIGRVNGRAFAFCAGIGIDAAIVRAVERRFRIKKKVGEPFFVVQGLRTFFFAYPRRESAMILRTGNRTIADLRSIIVCNSNPFTFLGERPFQMCPLAEQEIGLDVVGLTSLRTATALRILWRAFGSGGHTKLRSVRYLHDVDSFRVEAPLPLPYQVDGDFAGEERTLEFETLRNALAVIA